MNIVYDCETYPNCFILCAEDVDSGLTWCFEISAWQNDAQDLLDWLNWLMSIGGLMVGFNNLAFDYPLIHELHKGVTPQELFNRAQFLIRSEDKFAHMVWPTDRRVRQLDLFKLWHFDNFARQTSLKALEFNMRLKNISDLPYPVGTLLNVSEIYNLRKYCAHDVAATKQFYKESLPQIEFREQLSSQLPGDLLNYSDVKLGKAIFQDELESSGVVCYDYSDKGRTPRQTPRPTIRLADCIPTYIELRHPHFREIQQRFLHTTISETKGAFKDMTAIVGGLEFVFGTGGIHASVENRSFVADDDYAILDIDVISMYPSLAIENNYYPAHLGPKFVEVYRKLKAKRVGYKKGTVENAALKLALNGVYGASNDKFSIFYDPLFTMQITITGQLVMAMLAERLASIPFLQIIQCNTDGVTVLVRRDDLVEVGLVCRSWMDTTKLELEFNNYTKMFVADVNSYVAIDEQGKIKRKGRYEYDVEWHQDASALVVPKVAEKVLLTGAPVMQSLREWPDKMDFMLRAKVPRTSKLMYVDPMRGERQLENTQRYYMSLSGGALTKVMPPLAKEPKKWRRINIQSGYGVCPCNDMDDATMSINFEWYAKEVEKLVLPVL